MQKRLPSGQPRHIHNNNYLPSNNNNKKSNNYDNSNNNNKYNNNNDYNHNKNIKRPSSQYNNRIIVKQNNNFPVRNNIQQNKIPQIKIKNNNVYYNGQNFDMKPYKRENKANYGKLDMNQYRQNNKLRFNNYLNNGGRNKDYNKQVNAHRHRVNQGNNIHREGKYHK